MVQQAAGAGDHNLSAAIQRLGLRSLAHAAIDGDAGNPGMFPQSDGRLMDLFRKLAGWSDDESAHRSQGACDQSLENREHEAGGLAGPGLGQTQDIVPFEGDWDSLFLDRGRLDVACGLDAGKHTLVEVQLFEIQREYSLTPLSQVTLSAR